MARLPRLAAAGHVHLVAQRGHDGGAIVRDDADRERLLQLLRAAAAENRVAVHAWALSDQALMLLATPVEASGLGRAMQALGRRYVAGFNRRHGRSGTLWDGRFRSTVIEPEAWLLPCICYVETSGEGGLGEPGVPRWASARGHLGLAPDPLLSEHPLYWATGNTPFEREAAHRALLDRGLADGQRRAIDYAIAKGWALGSAAFVARLTEACGRRAGPARRGRPRRAPG